MKRDVPPIVEILLLSISTSPNINRMMLLKEKVSADAAKQRVLDFLNSDQEVTALSDTLFAQSDKDWMRFARIRTKPTLPSAKQRLFFEGRLLLQRGGVQPPWTALTNS